ncbi:MAG TPA: PsiF family protein [Thauera sp.]|jgi:hypothetical protein|nr:PsiF family protein [Thauera sp.]HRA81600.1 PsiF family protein [Thauera sp.]
MNKFLSVLAASLALVSMAPADALANPQHERMKRCNADAKEQALKGDARKAFMSTCLKGRHEGTTAQPAAAASPASTVAATASTPVVQPVAPAKADGVPAGAPLASAVLPAVSTEKKKACAQAAAEQSLSGAKRKAFLAECIKG